MKFTSIFYKASAAHFRLKSKNTNKRAKIAQANERKFIFPQNEHSTTFARKARKRKKEPPTEQNNS